LCFYFAVATADAFGPAIWAGRSALGRDVRSINATFCEGSRGGGPRGERVDVTGANNGGGWEDRSEAEVLVGD